MGTNSLIGKNKAYDWLDERSGVWTTIHCENDRVIVVLRKTHARGRWAGILFLASMIGLWLSSLFGTCSTLMIVLVVVLVVHMIGKLVGLSRSKLPSVYLTILDDGKVVQEANDEGDCLYAGDIESIRLRRNSGCDISDMSMWQVYLHVRQSETAKLVYQEPCTRRGHERAKEIAVCLGRRWNIPVVDENSQGDL